MKSLILGVMWLIPVLLFADKNGNKNFDLIPLEVGNQWSWRYNNGRRVVETISGRKRLKID